MTRTVLTVSTAAALVLAAAPAYADGQKKETQLPGVDSGYSIVKTVPEGEPDRPVSESANRGNHKRFKAGNWEVEVSGYVWYQIGASSR